MVGSVNAGLKKTRWEEGRVEEEAEAEKGWEMIPSSASGSSCSGGAPNRDLSHCAIASLNSSVPA